MADPKKKAGSSRKKSAKKKVVLKKSSFPTSRDEVTRGRMSTFGGPNDPGVSPSEGLALVSHSNFHKFEDYFLERQPTGTTGLARRLNPDTFYLAARWSYSVTPKSWLAGVMVKVTNPETGATALAKPVDWGPAVWTNRVVDLSPGLAEHLGLVTDDECEISYPLPDGVSLISNEVSGSGRVTYPDKAPPALPDTLDFRDRMFEPTLIEVPVRLELETYLKSNPPILNQGQEGACTGFALATVVNYLLRTRSGAADHTTVSPRMLYEMARRHDEWPGEEYSGSSARGAMKGWHKHGVCSEELWPYFIGEQPNEFTNERLGDAQARPLGAYYRVNHQDIVAIHGALAEVGVVMATGMVHSGWNSVGASGRIRYQDGVLGGHAFAIVAYNDDGFWIQNSWGESWGRNGFGLLSYSDWLENARDVWVSRLGVPIKAQTNISGATFSQRSLTGQGMASFANLRPHIISLGNDGIPKDKGDFANSENDIRRIVREDFVKITKKWKRKRILLYAHGGLVSAKSATQRVAEYREVLLENEIYPLAFVWHSDFWTTLKNILKEAVNQRKTEGPLDATKDFMLNRLDDALEPIAVALGARMQWKEMKENAFAATKSQHGGAHLVIDEIAKLVKDGVDVEIHLAGHSAGAVFLAPMVEEMAQRQNLTIETLDLWAPACSLDHFKEYYAPELQGANRAIRRLALYTLTDRAEQDDHCAHLYNKSLLYLVSNALEEKIRIPLLRDGWPILGMEKFIERAKKEDGAFKSLMDLPHVEWIKSPNDNSNDHKKHSTSTTHGGFDDDEPTLRGLLRRILGSAQKDEFKFEHSASSLRDQRNSMGL